MTQWKDGGKDCFVSLGELLPSKLPLFLLPCSLHPYILVGLPLSLLPVLPSPCSPPPQFLLLSFTSHLSSVLIMCTLIFFFSSELQIAFSHSFKLTNIYGTPLLCQECVMNKALTLSSRTLEFTKGNFIKKS